MTTGLLWQVARCGHLNGDLEELMCSQSAVDVFQVPKVEQASVASNIRVGCFGFAAPRDGAADGFTDAFISKK